MEAWGWITLFIAAFAILALAGHRSSRTVGITTKVVGTPEAGIVTITDADGNILCVERWGVGFHPTKHAATTAAIEHVREP